MIGSLMEIGNPDERDWIVRLLPPDRNGDEAFVFKHEGREQTIALHDYRNIYKTPGLYEYVVQDLLHCASPSMAAGVIRHVLAADHSKSMELRVLDLGAGNGIVGELLKQQGIELLIGIDKIVEARLACLRDRPGVYDYYYTGDLLSICTAHLHLLEASQLNCLVAVGALGGGHVGAEGLLQTINLLESNSLIVLTVRHDMLNLQSDEAFGRVLKKATDSGALSILYRQRFVHRITTNGEPIEYIALAARLLSKVPLKRLEGSSQYT
jgi:hypothetical protein